MASSYKFIKTNKNLNIKDFIEYNIRLVNVFEHEYKTAVNVFNDSQIVICAEHGKTKVCKTVSFFGSFYDEFAKFKKRKFNQLHMV